MFDTDDHKMLRRQRHFLDELERDVRAANRQLIHEEIPALSRQCFMDLARNVARKRLAYLRQAIELSRLEPGTPAEAQAFAAMPTLRAAYNESREAFAALERAIERGYIDIDMSGLKDGLDPDGTDAAADRAGEPD